MIAVWLADAFAAIARDSSDGGTSAGSSACIVGIWNARAAPTTKISAKIACAVMPAERAADAKAQGGERFGDHAELQHAAAVEMIGDVAGDQHQEERRHELREPDEPEVERAAGQRVDLPSDGDREHLVRDHREHAREPEQHERPVREQRRIGGRQLAMRRIPGAIGPRRSASASPAWSARRAPS